MNTKKILIIFITCILFWGCEKQKSNTFYYDEKCVIIERGGYSERNGKYDNKGNYFLIRRVSDTTEFTELNGYNWNDLADHYGSSLYYSKKVGDTLFFEHIKKDRFWRKR